MEEVMCLFVIVFFLSDSLWTTYQLECSRTAKIWEWNSHSTSPWKSTRAYGMRMIGPLGVGLRRQTGPRPPLLLPTKASTSMGVKPQWRPSFVPHRARDGGTRRSSKILMPISTGVSNGSAPNSPFTTIALIESDTLISPQSASETETYDSWSWMILAATPL